MARRTAALLVLVLVSAAVSGCVGEEESSSLTGYALSTEDVSNGSATLLSEESSRDRLVKRWALSADASPLTASTNVETDLRTSTGNLERDFLRSGNWTPIDTLNVGERAELFVRHPMNSGDGQCGFRVVLVKKGIVSIMDITADCESFSNDTDSAREYAERLARRQATKLEGYPDRA